MVDTKELCGAETDRGFNQTTASGKPFWTMDPRPEDVRIEDIAAQLSRICRFGGALKDKISYPMYPGSRGRSIVDVEIYSVAQHCDLVSRNVPPEYALEGLLHDAAEAFIGDMIKPIKTQLVPDYDGIRRMICILSPENGDYVFENVRLLIPDYKRVEKRVDAAIRRRFGLPAEESEFIKVADYRAVLTEHRDLQNCDGSVDWGVAKLPPFDEQIIPVLPSVARQMFLDRFNELYKGE